MKKVLRILSILFVGVLIFGCSSVEKQIANEKMAKGYEDAPKWILGVNGDYKGMIAGVGSHKMSDAGLSYARSQAQLDAKSKIASTLETEIQSMTEQKVQEKGFGDEANVASEGARIMMDKQQTIMKGIRQEEAYVTGDKTVHVLMVLDRKLVEKEITKVLENMEK